MSRAIFRSTGVVGSMTLLSRITGLLRDMVYARMFPTGTGLMDAFLVAYQIPNTLRRLFAEGAFSQAFVPVVAEYRARKTSEDVRDLVDSTAGTLGVVVFVVSLLGVIAAPILILVLGPGFHERGTFDLAVEMLRWTFPYLFFISLTALAGGVLNSYGRFALPALTSVALNLTAIVFAAWMAPRTQSPGVTLAIGVFVAGLIQLVIQIPPAPETALAAPSALEFQARRRTAHRQADGPRHSRLVDGPDQRAHQFVDRDDARNRQRRLALLRRSPG